MNTLPCCYGIIPCRYGSTRFKGKPLADIMGRPMFWHVYDRASQCKDLTRVVLATDDDRIFSEAEELGVPVEMTRNDHPSGSDRVLEAAKKIGVHANDIVINIQGDEPALDHKVLTKLITPFADKKVQVTTPVRKMEPEEKDNHDRVKVVFNKDHKALYFSRSLIPFSRDKKPIDIFFHIGIYAFRMKTLKKFVEMGPGYIERIERLEQLRLLENSIPIHVVETEYKSVGVDREKDISEVEKIIKENLALMKRLKKYLPK